MGVCRSSYSLPSMSPSSFLQLATSVSARDEIPQVYSEQEELSHSSRPCVDGGLCWPSCWDLLASPSLFLWEIFPDSWQRRRPSNCCRQQEGFPQLLCIGSRIISSAPFIRISLINTIERSENEMYKYDALEQCDQVGMYLSLCAIKVMHLSA